MSGTCTLGSVTIDGTTYGPFTLPADIEWDDEGAWMPVAQVVATSITGAQIVQVSAVQAGRPITLIARGDKHVWLAYSAISALRAAAAANLSAPMVLTLIDDRTFSVLWRHQDKAVEFGSVEYIVGNADFNASRPYTLTLRFMQA